MPLISGSRSTASTTRASASSSSRRAWRCSTRPRRSTSSGSPTICPCGATRSRATTARPASSPSSVASTPSGWIASGETGGAYLRSADRPRGLTEVTRDGGPMRKYLAQRLLIAVPTIFGVTLLIFVAMRVLPGDPLSAISGEGGGTYVLSQEQLQAARKSLGLDRPYVVQYLDWVRDVLRGDLGKSFWRGEPIRELIFRRAPITGQIALMAVVLSWLIGLPVGLIGALWRNSWTDYAFRLVVTLFMAIPSFWVGLMIVLSLVLTMTWRPPLTIAYFWDDPVRNLQITAGPALALGVALAAMMARITRSSVLEVLGEDYVRTARAKGLRERSVVWRHALVNAMLPILTVTGTALGALLGGSVAVERAFSVPGLGLALVFAVAERDWMLIQNLVLLYGRSEEHTSELQSLRHLVCRLLLEKKKKHHY